MGTFIDNLCYDKDGVLTLDGWSLEEMCRRHGTPLFVASRARIEENVNRFNRAFSGYKPCVLLAYSSKTNSNLGILQTLHQAGIHAAVCSGLDYTAARLAGFPPERIFLDGLVKLPNDVARAVREKIRLINVESWEELQLVDEISRQEGCVTPVGLRVRIGPPLLDSFSIKNLLGISYDRFGFDVRSGLLYRVLEKALGLSHVRIEGLLVHEGSHYHCARPYLRSLRQVMPIVQKLAQRSPGSFQYLNLGGGFGVSGVRPYTVWDRIPLGPRRRKGQAASDDRTAQSFDLDRMAADIVTEVTATFQKAGLAPPTLVFEPGRWVTGDAILLVGRILLRKDVPRSGTWLILDAGTNLFPYLLSLNEEHRFVPVRTPTIKTEEWVHLAGPLLYSSDILAKNYSLPHLEAGALLALLDAGAYTLAYSNQFLYPRPAMVLLDRNQEVRIIRKAETHQDVLRQDQTYPSGA